MKTDTDIKTANNNLRLVATAALTMIEGAAGRAADSGGASGSPAAPAGDELDAGSLGDPIDIAGFVHYIVN